MTRITTKQLEALAERACKAAGLNWAPHYAKQPDGRYQAVVGAVQLSKSYSGWNLEKIVNSDGGVSAIDGRAIALSASEMQAFLHGLKIGAELAAKAEGGAA